MNIEDLTIREARKLAALFGPAQSISTDCLCEGVEIVVLQRGWVVVGKLSKSGSEYKLINGYVVRNWGTTNGLGELAEHGPQTGTKLDPIPEASFHELTVVLRMKCSSKWEALCKDR